MTTPSTSPSPPVESAMAVVEPTIMTPAAAMTRAHVDYDRRALAVERFEHYIDLQVDNDRFRIRL